MTRSTSASIEAELRLPKVPSTTISREEVAAHNTEASSWVIINDKVYDITKFAELHPGGEQIIRQFAGKDATEAFFDLHRNDVLLKYDRLVIGKLNESHDPVDSVDLGQISRVPYSEGTIWRPGWGSPYYNESHKNYRADLRLWFANNVRDEAVALALADQTPPLDLNRKIGQANLYAARMGPGPHLRGRVILGVNGEDFDVFHQLITHQEWNRLCGYPAVQDGLGTGLVIGLPPVIHFGKSAKCNRVVEECLNGDKRICLAISEPFAGSDVANIQTVATKSEDGKFYIVSGIKKWITNATFCDYFVTAVRTGGPGIAGISLLLIERSEGLETKPIKTSYGSAAGTGYIIMENVKVPVENILGEENGGFQCIMSNFNHERWFIVCLLAGSCRGITEEAFRWTMQRKVFGKTLIHQPVIRQKLAAMISKTEALENWLESITYQMKIMAPEEQFFQLGGTIALLKMYGTRVSYEINDDVCQIFGGRAITNSGMGKYVEQYQRSIKYGAILGGSEEIMADLGVRLAQRSYPPNARL